MEGEPKTLNPWGFRSGGACLRWDLRFRVQDVSHNFNSYSSKRAQ